jgi:hydrogenase/urease accessory protein HupE
MKRSFPAVFAILLSGVSASAWAHGVHGAAASFSQGFAHPFLGLDHAFAMMAIGVCAVQARFASVGWQTGAAACVSLVIGAILGSALPAGQFFELLVAASVCALGLLLLGRRFVAPAWALPNTSAVSWPGASRCRWSAPPSRGSSTGARILQPCR